MFSQSCEDGIALEVEEVGLDIADVMDVLSGDAERQDDACLACFNNNNNNKNSVSSRDKNLSDQIDIAQLDWKIAKLRLDSTKSPDAPNSGRNRPWLAARRKAKARPRMSRPQIAMKLPLRDEALRLSKAEFSEQMKEVFRHLHTKEGGSTAFTCRTMSVAHESPFPIPVRIALRHDTFSVIQESEDEQKAGEELTRCCLDDIGEVCLGAGGLVCRIVVDKGGQSKESWTFLSFKEDEEDVKNLLCRLEFGKRKRKGFK